MKKRSMKLMALMLTICMSSTSLMGVQAADLGTPMAEESLMSDSLGAFEAEEPEELPAADETEETSGFESQDSSQDEESVPETSGDELLEAAVKVVKLGTDAAWKNAGSGEKVPTGSIGKKLYKISGSAVSAVFYDNTDGLVQVVDGDKSYTYMFDEDGFPVTGVIMIDGKNYYFTMKDSVEEESQEAKSPVTGRMQKNYWMLAEANNADGYEWIYYGSDGAQTAGPAMEKKDAYLEGTDVEWSYEPNTSVSGKVPFRLRRVGSDSRYFTALDGLVTVKSSNREVTYAFDNDGMLLEGYQKVGGENRYFISQKEATLLPLPGVTGDKMSPTQYNVGAMVREGWILYNDGKTWGYFGVDGVQESKQGYVQIGVEHYYLDENGDILTGNIEVSSGQTRYFDPSTNPMGQERSVSQKEGWIREGSAWKYVTQSGAVEIRTGFQKIVSGTVNAWYYLDKNGVPETNVMKKHSNGKYYYFGDDGARVNNAWKTIDGNQYYFGSTGTAYSGGWKTIDKKKYYFDSSCKRVKKAGWFKIGKYWYYFSASGNMQYNKLFTVGGKKYYVNANGVMVGGLRKVGDYYYYFKWSQGNTRYGYALTSRWVKTKGYWYYANSAGRMQKGWITLGTKTYYLNSKYQLLTDKWVTHPTQGRGYIDKDGVFHKGTGWVNVNGKWRYLKDGASGGFATGWTRIGGYKYYFKSNGDMMTDLSTMAGFTGGPYRYDINRTTCTVTVLGKDENGSFTVPVIAFACSVGLPSTPTPLGGPYPLSKGGRWQMLMGPSWGQYATHLDGAGQGGIFFHSVAGSAPNSYSISAGNYNMLGSPASHGCIRLTVRDAKWIWDHWGSGGNTAVVVDRASNIFYKPSVPKVGPGTNYDPTDPAL